MQGGQPQANVPVYFLHLKTLFLQAHALEVINSDNLNAVPCKEIYADLTSSFPPPKIIYKYEDLPWNEIWGRLNLPVLSSEVQDLMFLLIHIHLTNT